MKCNVLKTVIVAMLITLCTLSSCCADDVSPDPFEYVHGQIDTYTEVARIGNPNGYTAMQGFTILNGYGYCLKESGEAHGLITRTNLSTGETKVLMLKNADGTKSTDAGSLFHHGNDLGAAMIDGKINLFVATLKTSSTSDSLIRLIVNEDDNTYTVAGNFGTMYGADPKCFSAVDFYGYKDGVITLIGKNGKSIFFTTLNTSQSSGTLTFRKIASVKYYPVPFEGQSIDLSNGVNQGFHYCNGEIYVPVSMDSYKTTYVMIYSLQLNQDGTSATLYPLEGRTLRFVETVPSSSKAFEVEALACDPTTGKMYFNLNRSDYNNVARDGIMSIDYPLPD